MRELDLVVNKKIKTLAFEGKELRLCVACSAGVDSTVLLHLLLRARQDFKALSLAICHVNYGLRGEESREDETFLERLAQKYDLPFFSFHPEKNQKVHEEKIGIQAWARKERYRFFDELGKKGWKVVLAHTEDDLLETILGRLLRGTSPLGGKGMSEFHKIFWRPLLEVSKDSVKKWALEEGVPWREDRSNASRDYTRNRLRLDVVPTLEKLYPGSSKRLIRYASESQDLAVFTKEALMERAENFLQREESRVVISLDFFEGLSRGVVGLFLAEVLRDFAGEIYVPEDKLLSVLYTWISRPFEDRSQRQLARDMFCKIQDNRLIFEKI